MNDQTPKTNQIHRHESQLRQHESRCDRQLLRLRMLALRQDGTELSRRAADEIQDAIRAVVSETEAMSLVASGRRETRPHTFLQVRIARLKTAAGQAADAARGGDIRGLRAHVRHVDTLASAIRTVLHSVPGQSAPSAS